MKKKLLALSCMALASTMMLGSCFGGGNSDESSSTSGGSSNKTIVAPKDLTSLGFDSTYNPSASIKRQQGTIDVVLLFEGTVKGWEALAAEYSRLHGGEVAVNLNTTYTDAKVYQQNLGYELSSDNPTWDIIQGNLAQGELRSFAMNMYNAVKAENLYAGDDLVWEDVLMEDAYITDKSGATEDTYIMNSEGLETAWFINTVALEAAKKNDYNGPDNPKTWDQLMDLCAAMKAAGYKNPLGIALDDDSIGASQFTWLLRVYGDYFYRNEYQNIMVDEDKFIYDATSENPESNSAYSVSANKFFYSLFAYRDNNYYVGPESKKFQEFIENFQKMRPYLRSNSAQTSLSGLRDEFATQSKGKDGKESPQIFLDYLGAGLKFKQNEDANFKVDFFDYPVMESNLIDDETVLRDVGGNGGYLSIVKHNDKQDALSLDFIKFVMSPYGQSIYYDALSKAGSTPMGMTTVVSETVVIPTEWKTFFADEKIKFQGLVDSNPYISYLIRSFSDEAKTTAKALENWKKYLTSETFTTDDFVQSWDEAMAADWVTYCKRTGKRETIKDSREGTDKL